MSGWEDEAREAIANGASDHRWTREETMELIRDLASTGLRKGDRVRVNLGHRRGVEATVMGYATKPWDRGGSLLLMLDLDSPGAMDSTGFYSFMLDRIG